MKTTNLCDNLYSSELIKTAFEFQVEQNSPIYETLKYILVVFGIESIKIYYRNSYSELRINLPSSILTMDDFKNLKSLISSAILKLESSLQQKTIPGFWELIKIYQIEQQIFVSVSATFTYSKKRYQEKY